MANRGEGPSLGAAFRDMVGEMGGRMVSYSARGWHAQLVALTGTQRGMGFLDAAGINVTQRTLLSWLSSTGEKGDRAPSKANQQMIREAYGRASHRGLPSDLTSGGKLHIHGTVATGRDSRDRGEGSGRAPFEVNLEYATWDKIEQLWNEANTDDHDWEAAIIEDLIEEDPALGDGSDGWQFPGGAYAVVKIA